MEEGEYLVSRSSELAIDFVRRVLLIDGKVAPLGSRAFDILATLARAPGKLVSSRDLLESVWPSLSVDDAALRVHISAIRKALGDRRHVLSTSAGHGYRLVGNWEWHRRASDWAAPREDGDGRVRTNLPATILPLIGRESEIAKLEALVSGERLVTLAGTGGIGKTSLAREIARRALSTFDGEIWFVDLAPLSEGRAVFSAIASTLSLDLSGLPPTAASVSRAIGSRRLYLVLDNCEHVVDAVAEVAEAINRTCRFTNIVATSREVLRAEHEHVSHVPPLEVPREEDRELDKILRYGAAALFVARARALNAAFEPRPDEAPAIVETCRRLDGLPLAIEFAAAQAAAAGSVEVASRLVDSLRSGGRRTALPRHQTLRATLEWSYSLLTGDEQTILRRISIFAGAFDLSSAERVVAGDGVAAGDVKDLLFALRMKSLVSLVDAPSGSGYRLLETTREFAHGLLASSAEHGAIAGRHAEYVCDRLKLADADAVALTRTEWLVKYGRYLDDVRVALQWSLAKENNIELGATLAASAIPLWNLFSLLTECQEWISLALRKLGPDANQGGSREMKLFTALGNYLMHSVGPADEAAAIGERALEIAERVGDVDYQLRALLALWNGCFATGDVRKSKALALRFRQVAAASSDPADVLLADRLYGTSIFALGNTIEARVYLEKMVVGYAKLPHDSNLVRFQVDQLASGRALLTLTLLQLGLLDQARRMAEDCLEEVTRANNAMTLGGIVSTTCVVTALMLHDEASLERYVSILEDHSRKFGLTVWLTIAMAFGAIIQLRNGNVSDGMRTLTPLVEDVSVAGNLRYPLILCEYALALARSGAIERGRSIIRQCLAQAELSGAVYSVAEFLRTEAALRRIEAPSAHAEVEALLVRALECARLQGSRLHELLVTTDLARLLFDQGRNQDALELLSPVYDSFVEGRQTQPLINAERLLEALRA